MREVENVQLTVVSTVLLSHDEVVDAEVAARLLEVLTPAQRLNYKVLQRRRNTNRLLIPFSLIRIYSSMHDVTPTCVHLRTHKTMTSQRLPVTSTPTYCHSSASFSSLMLSSPTLGPYTL